MTLEAQDNKGLSVYWDYETTRLPNFRTVSGFEVVKNIRSALHTFGPIQSFKTYHDSSNQPSPNLHAELGSSGLTLIDCPSNGRKETPTKTMIVDIIAHAWDHPAPRTIVVITGDRDLAYLLATLRMRKFQVVLVSPSGTHASLTIQASVNIDWTTGMLNIEGRGTDMEDPRRGQPPSHPPLSPQPSPSPHLLPSPSLPPPPLPTTSGRFSHFPKTDFLSKAREEIDPPIVELRGMPTTRGRKNSIFARSYEPDRFNVFDDLSRSFASPSISNDMFGRLGDGPLFARSQSRVSARQMRSDSAPPGIVYSTHSPSTSPPPERISFDGIPSSMKGKQREFPITEPEDIALHYPMPKVVESTSVNGMTEASSAKPNAPLPSGTSARSSATTQDSVFSMIQFPLSSATTSADAAYLSKDERGKNAVTIIDTAPQETTPASLSPTVRDMDRVPVPDPSSRKDAMSEAIPNKASPVQPQTPNSFGSSPAPPPSSMKAPPKEIPPKFRVLAETLRQHNGSCLDISLPSLLLARDPNVYRKAQISKYKKYIAAAIEAGLVRQVATIKGPSIFLAAQYTA